MGFGSFSGDGLGFGAVFTLEDRFSNTASEIERSMSKLEQNTDAMQNKVNSSLDRMKVGAATLGVGLAILTPYMLSLKNASDLQENINKTEVAFGSYATKVKDFANNSLDNFGIDKIRALDMASMFGDMSTGMGLTQEKASKLSMDLVGLAGDLSSFKNISHEQAQTALAGIFTGETESLKRLGIVMTQTNVDAFLATQGITKSIKDMSQTEAIMARFNFVMNASKNSLGDFYRTQDSYANVKRKFEGAIRETSATLGGILMPIAAKLMSGLMGLVRVFQKFAESKFGHFVLTAVAVLGIFLVVVGTGIFLVSGLKFAMYQSANAFGAQTRAALISTFATGGLTASMGALATATWAALAPLLPFIAIGLVLVGVIAGIYMSVNKASESFDGYMKSLDETNEKSKVAFGFWEQLGGILRAVGQIWNSFNGKTFEIDENVYNALERMGVADLALAIGSYLVRIKAFFMGVWDGMKQAYNFVKEMITPIFVQLKGAVVSLFERMGIDIGKATSSLSTWATVGKYVGMAFLLALSPIIIIVGVIAGAIYGVITLGMAIYDFLKDLDKKFQTFVVGMAAKGKSMMSNFLQGLKSMASEIIAWIDKFISGIPIIGDMYGMGKGIVGAGVDVFNTIKHSFDEPTPQPVPVLNRGSFAMQQAEMRGGRYGAGTQNYFTPTINVPASEHPPVNVILDGDVIHRANQKREALNNSRT